ncbi:phosphopantetheine-binding protein [Pseudomonas japonica]|uniref:Acyl carrier protein n=1 Tax=Pseudomonas japonica TaxID=256466 RepID=A0A239EIN5_9PSED|nr:phosphopantetheine-binding protein [Pseudomonas japonica]SNS44261.1 acyl carrier protein [Pseudomonas japonica]
MADKHSEEVIRFLVEHLNLNRTPTAQDRLMDLGLDSLDVVEVLLELQEQIASRIPDNAISAETTVGQLIALTKK